MPITQTPAPTAPRRVNYFSGRLLTANDLQSEQSYHRERQRRHNVYLHAAGVLQGLAVTCSGPVIRVTAGLALDCAGREICVPEPVELALGRLRQATVYVLLGYAERGVDLVPAPGGDGGVPSRIEESYALSPGPAPGPHGRRGPGWRCCQGEHPMPLARLARIGGRWRVEARYRRPAAG